ncbi:agamous-like MADS-box protein AGL80 [Sesamum indicum]|uniref:Agamous-like MADS-box protein AGL80 n=1 Tax=Sesamum indicum TaxID=4182 RepID=A0A6I9TSQ2_SESIN|nr:agamous-like MADS-box protein AGL80 [Sesamum indicum]
MTRKKVTLAYITNDSERKASFKKRKKGLIKKVSELSTLCGVDACAIIYSQYDQEPEVWPSPLGAQAVLARFRKLSEMDQTRKMVNQESFTRQRIKKAEDQLRRVQKENKRKELENFMFQCLAGMATLEDFNLRDAAEMGWVVNQTLREINTRMETLQKTGQHQQPAVGEASGSAPAGAAVAVTVAVAPPPPPVQMVAPPPPPPLQMVAPLPPPPPPPTMNVDPPLPGEENMESFPWNLVESPTGAGGAALYGSGLAGWDDGVVLPYPYIFNHGNNSSSGTQPGQQIN